MGVVVVEDILRCKTNLKLKNQSVANILKTLEELAQKIPPRHLLKSTKIGHVVASLGKHEDEAVRTAAMELISTWREHHESKIDRPRIEVACDQRTQRLRDKGRALLATQLGLPAENALAESIEREVYRVHEHHTSAPYRRGLRALVFTLKHQQQVREQVANAQLPVTEFVAKYMASAKS